METIIIGEKPVRNANLNQRVFQDKKRGLDVMTEKARTEKANFYLKKYQYGVNSEDVEYSIIPESEVLNPENDIYIAKIRYGVLTIK